MIFFGFAVLDLLGVTRLTGVEVYVVDEMVEVEEVEVEKVVVEVEAIFAV